MATDVGNAAAPGVPTGTVTFLFSDIEGSTRRWESHRAAMQQAVRKHDDLMHAAMSAQQGYVFKTVGDEFCVAFPNVPRAVEAALAAQRAILAEDWSAVGGLRVRMALHTGLADERDGDYFGPVVNRVARLLSIGHGEQVLVSGITTDLAREFMPKETSLRDLGLHRLKDLTFPEQVYQLCAADLRLDFPPLRSLELHAHNLPQQLSSFVGRESELHQVRALLERARLVAVVGAGGVGKTRMALQLAAEEVEHFPDGVWLVELAPLRDGELIDGVLASVLGISSTAGETPRQAIVHALRGKRTLLIFDNCEHLVREAAILSETLLLACPNLRIIATSREALSVQGESIYRIPSLALPPATSELTPEEARDFDAVALFEERARQYRPDFALSRDNLATVNEICRRLDGIALAIELATAKLKFLSLKSLLEHLNERFRLLTGGSRTALPRQQTMRALIDWSYDLLSDAERRLFRRLSVFAGGWTLESAGSVCSDETLAEVDFFEILGSLVDKSLVAVEVTPEDQRYRMLESTREYGRERLIESAEDQRFARRHAEHMERTMSAFYERYWSSPAFGAVRSVAPEIDNLRVALTWALLEAADSQLGARIAALSASLFVESGLHVEGSRWLSLADSGVVEEDLWNGRLAIGRYQMIDGTLNEAALLCERAVELFRRSAAKELAWALTIHAMSLWRRHRNEEALAEVGEAVAIARADRDRVRTVMALRSSAVLGAAAGDLSNEAVQAQFEEALRIARGMSDDLRVAGVLSLYAEWAMKFDAARSATLGREALAIARRVGNARATYLAHNLAGYLLAAGEAEEAISLARDALRTAVATNVRGDIAFALQRLALGAVTRERYEDAARLFGFVEAQFARLDLASDFTEELVRQRTATALEDALAPSLLERLVAEGAEMVETDATALALSATS